MRTNNMRPFAFCYKQKKINKEGILVSIGPEVTVPMP